MLERSAQEEIEAIILEPDVDRKLRLSRALCRNADRIGRAMPGRGAAASVGPPPSASRPEGKPVRDGSSLVPVSDPTTPSSRWTPGRPASWSVCPVGEVPDRSRLGSERGRYQLLHSVAHIELSAVELALVAVADYPEQPSDYYREMLQVAREEVGHTQMLRRRLRQLGGELGTEPVHLGLWETAVAHAGLTERLAVVPRILEARGLDVSEKLRMGLGRNGDAVSAEILLTIYRDEISHVAVGTRWYRAACDLAGVDSEEHFVRLVERFRPRRGGSGLDEVGRREAGFTARELDALSGGRASSADRDDRTGSPFTAR